MKFWKQSLLTAASVIGIASTVLYTACEKDSCANLSCQNNGSCTSGVCHCPAGWEGTQCETLAATRFLGTYYGSTSCDQATTLIDTVDVIKVDGDLVTLELIQHSNPSNIIYGTIGSNTSGYFILVPPQSQPNFQQTISVQLVDVTKLIMHSQTVTNGVSSSCTFTGVRH